MSRKKTKRFRDKQPINWLELSFKYFLKREDTLLGLSKQTLDVYRVGWDGESFTIPMYNTKEIIGIQRRFPDGSKSCVEGSQLGLFKNSFLPYCEKKKIIICEGFSDAATATECGYWGLGYPSASFGHQLVVDFLVRAAITNVTIVADNNSVGQKSAEKIRDFCEQKCIGNRIVQVKPYKDLREFYEKEGEQSTVKLLKGKRK